MALRSATYSLMKSTGNMQINSKIYWDYIYTTPAREMDYWAKTNRFPKAVEYVKDGDKVIDLGCGVNIIGRMIKKERKNCEIWGIDISSKVINKNRKDNPDGHYFQGYIGNLKSIPENYFNVVFSGETIEHLDDPSWLFSDAYRLLKKSGMLIITTPQEEHIDSPEHVWYFSKEDIITLFTDAGFTHPTFVDLPDMEHMIIFFAVGKK